MKIEDLREKLSHIDNAFPMPEELNTPPKAVKKPKNSYGFTILAACMVGILLLGTGILTANIGSMKWENTVEKRSGAVVSDPQNGQSQVLIDPESANYSLFQQTILRLKNAREVADEYGAMMWEEANIAPDGAAPGGSLSKSGSASTLYGGTNTQVGGIDEADVIKNDGQYLYCLTNSGGRNHVKIIAPSGGMSVVSTITLDADVRSPELYVEGNRLVVSYEGGGTFDRSAGYSSTATKAAVYDISDRTAPKRIKTFSQEGSSVSSRLMNGRLYLVSNSYVNLNFEMEGNKIPMDKVLPMVSENDKTRLIAEKSCFVLPDTETAQYLIVSSMDVSGGKGQTQTSAVLGSNGQMYMSQSGIFVASESYNSWNAKTNIYKFSVSANGNVTKGESAVIDGTALNQFSMDEHNGYFRIATTVWNGSNTNGITVLDSNLKVVGKIDGLARNESIKSCRFIGNTAYMVTFRQTDPLFVIDLSNPSAPEVKGELKINGFSAYLHPWDETHLIGIGPDGTETGTNRDTKISLFDVSNPSNPIEVSKYVIESAESYVGQNHKVFTRYGGGSVFGLPFRTYTYDGEYYQSSANTYKLFDVIENKVTNRNTLDVPDDVNGPGVRGTYINDVWYVSYGGGISSFDIVSGAKIGEIKY